MAVIYVWELLTQWVYWRLGSVLPARRGYWISQYAAPDWQPPCLSLQSPRIAGTDHHSGSLTFDILGLSPGRPYMWTLLAARLPSCLCSLQSWGPNVTRRGQSPGSRNCSALPSAPLPGPPAAPWGGQQSGVPGVQDAHLPGACPPSGTSGSGRRDSAYAASCRFCSSDSRCTCNACCSGLCA